ncbi:MAG: hypothetical protein HY716_00970 [Planctomycetes bacterium]|nr:hypothetical protein [Planctomycetota bacterium]
MSAPRYVLLDSRGIRWRVAPEYRPLFESGPFADLGRLLGSARVLKDLRVKRMMEVSAGGRAFLVKLYRGQGAWRRFKEAIFGSRAMRELKQLERTARRRVPVMPLAAAGERGSESYVVVEKAGDRVGLDRLLAEVTGARRRALIEEYGRWARRVHEAGVAQYDFNPTNVLARASGAPDLRLIDFERVSLRRSMPERSRLRALAKIDRMIRASRADRLRFLKAYLGISDVAARACLVVRYAEEQRKRDARRRRAACVGENRNYGRFEAGKAWGFYLKAREGRDGLLSPDVAELVEGLNRFRAVRVERALKAWKEANGAPGGDLPLAVILERGRRDGVLVYDRSVP